MTADRVKNTSRTHVLRKMGEEIIEEVLRANGFSDIEVHKSADGMRAFAHYMALRGEKRYAIRLLTRNHEEWHGGKPNPRFKIDRSLRDAANVECSKWKAEPGWVACVFAPETVNVYFGTLELLDDLEAHDGRGAATGVRADEEILDHYEKLAHERKHNKPYESFRNWDPAP